MFGIIYNIILIINYASFFLICEVFFGIHNF